MASSARGAAGGKKKSRLEELDEVRPMGVGRVVRTGMRGPCSACGVALILAISSGAVTGL
jgi:hypothetical protein